MLKELALNLIVDQLERVSKVQSQLLNGIEAYELKRLGIQTVGAEIGLTLDKPVEISTIKPINPALGNLFGWLTFAEFKFLQSFYEILENRPLFDSEGNINAKFQD